MRQFSQLILPTAMPMTTVWGYGAIRSASSRGLLIHHAPSLTIETTWKRPVRIKWINDLVDGNGDFRPHLLPVDPTLDRRNVPTSSWTSPPCRWATTVLPAAGRAAAPPGRNASREEGEDHQDQRAAGGTWPTPTRRSRRTAASWGRVRGMSPVALPDSAAPCAFTVMATSGATASVRS